MAGDWIKVATATPDKPEVIRAARLLGVDRDLVLGKLVRMWAWFDANSVDGVVDGVVSTDVDAVVALDGFTSVVASVGWVKFDDDAERVSLPNFGDHNGETAKKRALKAKRQEKWRRNSVDGGASTGASTREEKRREEKKEKQARAHALPDDFQPNERNRQLSGELSVSLTDELGRFTDYHKAKGSKFKDWHSALNNWLRNAAKFEKEKTGQAAPKLKEYRG